jgi:para-nitrobenzyl esterase
MAASPDENIPVFVYRFDWDEEPSLLGADLSRLLGAAHMIEVPFVFADETVGTDFSLIFNRKNAPGREALSGSMASYWAEFAYTGSPQKGRDGKQPEWGHWRSRKPEGGRFVILDTPQDGGIRMSEGVLSITEVKKRLLADDGFVSQEAHCRAYAALFGDADGFFSDRSLWDASEYANLGREGCRLDIQN